MKPFLSIIIPVYKIKEEYLRECFNSLLAQTCDDFQVIVVDDGSPDNNGIICDEYAEKDSRFIVVHQKNAGVSVARNKGIEKANTEWISFVDPDDWVDSSYVATLLSAQQGYSDVDIFLFDYVQEFADKSSPKQLMQNSGYFSEEWRKNFRLAPFNFLTVDGKHLEYETNTIWNKMYKTALLKREGLVFDPLARKGQDVIFNAECFQLTDSFYYLKNTLYHYRYLQESVTNRYNPKVQFYNEIAFDNYERIIKKYNLPVEYKEAFYARVVTRMYSCMRLYYFHPENTKNFKEICREIDSTLLRYPYNESLLYVKESNLTISQRLFVYFLKRKKYYILRMLVNGRQELKKLKGDRLK